jgi:glucose/arabinose dehydrogenase
VAYAVASLTFAQQSKQPPYTPNGTCDGLPKIALTAAPGVCVGLAASGFKFPRGVLPLANGDVMVADMGGWVVGRGAIWKLKKAAQYQRERVLDKLNLPHGLTFGPDGKVYVGVAGGVLRFDPADPRGSLTYVIGGDSGVQALATDGRHPLVNLVFGQDRNLYVNVGSASDNCEGENHRAPDPKRPCKEAEGEAARGAIRQYRMQWPEGKVVESSVHASGLRNSMALAVHPQSGVLLQGENSRDNIHRHLSGLENDENLPHDELNVIERGARYGWPYCYDDNRPSPEYPGYDCTKFSAPAVLLPAHAAPLSMTYYSGAALPALQGKLVVAYHGYRKAGHRIVAFDVDAQGRPHGAGADVVSGWDAAEGRAMGAPPDIKAGNDGALYVSEDRNGTVLRITADRP